METFTEHLPRAVELARLIVQSRVMPGDLVVDATVGNGNDTLFLAELVGSGGKVLGFDKQETAIQITRAKTAGLLQVQLHHAGHETLAHHLVQAPGAAMFNLGYLPGADKQIITSPETTLEALAQITPRLRVRGVVTIVLYTGHPGGREEAEAIRIWCAGLNQTIYTVIEYQFVNQRNSPPFLIVIERKGRP